MFHTKMEAFVSQANDEHVKYMHTFSYIGNGHQHESTIVTNRDRQFESIYTIEIDRLIIIIPGGSIVWYRLSWMSVCVCVCVYQNVL